ncbi:hypothetical protein, partial [Klebsiella pneumoniae]|uniref:hypothetical protein n=1 Tax=Klebsiella pneumoniae TaxID=573 RepID=UPI00210AC014
PGKWRAERSEAGTSSHHQLHHAIEWTARRWMTEDLGHGALLTLGTWKQQHGAGSPETRRQPSDRVDGLNERH